MGLFIGTENADLSLEGTDQDDLMYGNGGDDIIRGLSGSDQLFGGAGNDLIVTGDGQDIVEGGAGDDDVNGYVIDTKNFSFEYYASTGSKTINGGAGSDFLAGGADADYIHGNADNDIIVGREGNDELYGDPGDDELSGDSGDDWLIGAEGDDLIFGGEGNDYLAGGDGNDELIGGNGNDTLRDGKGFDLLFGDKGDDTFHITSRDTVFIDSGGIDSVYVYTDFVHIPSNIESVTYASNTLPVPYWIDALIFGKAYSIAATFRESDQVFYTFPATPPSYTTDPELLLGYTGFSQAQILKVELALQSIANVVDLKFVRTDTAEDYDTLAFAYNSQTGTSGYAQRPYPNFSGSDIFLNNISSNATLEEGTRGTVTLMHEIGHALGLKHPFWDSSDDRGLLSDPILSTSENVHLWTVMSYDRDASRLTLEYSPLDIAALHYLYGVNPAARPNNDTYVFDGAGSNLIWDGSGTDIIDASTSASAVTINLTPGHWGFNGAAKGSRITAPGQITVNFGTVIENLKGSAFNDTLTGNEISNILTGGKGNDTIAGGAGIDIATFTGIRSHYNISPIDKGWRVADTATDRDGNDSLQGIERLAFSDVSLAFDLSGTAGTTAKILGAVLGKQSLSNSKFVGLGLSMLDDGMTPEVLMGLALDARLGSSASAGDFIDLLFNNIAGAKPSVADRDYFVGVIDSGAMSRSQLGLLAANTVTNEENINLIGLSSTGLTYS
ncbi:MAG: hypothetical protein V4751_09300 [Pseudomonadota bacterium]